MRNSKSIDAFCRLALDRSAHGGSGKPADLAPAQQDSTELSQRGASLRAAFATWAPAASTDASLSVQANLRLPSGVRWRRLCMLSSVLLRSNCVVSCLGGMKFQSDPGRLVCTFL